MKLFEFVEKTKINESVFKNELCFFCTDNSVFIDSNINFIANMFDDAKHIVQPTDYATLFLDGSDRVSKDEGCDCWLRQASAVLLKLHIPHKLFYFSKLGKVEYCDGAGVFQLKNAVRPRMHLSVKKIKSFEQKNKFGIKFLNENIKDNGFKFGSFPQTYVGKQLNEKLNQLYSSKSLKPTGKTYFSNVDATGKIYSQPEFEYCGKRYVMAKNENVRGNRVFKDGTNIQSGDAYWFKVEPIQWKVNNFDYLPKTVNPNGAEKENYVDVTASNCLIGGMPFYLNNTDDYGYLWRNSTIRGYLNGINVNNISEFDAEISASNGGDFSKCNNFLKDAFDDDALTLASNLLNNKKQMLLLEMIKPNKKPLAIEEKHFSDNSKIGKSKKREAKEDCKEDCGLEL